MRIVHRAQQRLALIRASMLPDRTGVEQPVVKLVAILESPRRHARWRAHRIRRLAGEWNVEGAILASEKAGRRERLDLFSFADIEALPDVDERGDGGVQGPQCARDDRANMRRRHRLRRSISGVPLILMPGVENESQVARGV